MYLCLFLCLCLCLCACECHHREHQGRPRCRKSRYDNLMSYHCLIMIAYFAYIGTLNRHFTIVHTANGVESPRTDKYVYYSASLRVSAGPY